MDPKKFILEFVVFLCGAVVMAYEIIGSRILGPYVGTSMFVWSSIIGIILLSLSAGYYYGGRVADRHPNYSRLALIIAASGIFILASLLFKKSLLEGLLHAIDNLHAVSILSSLLLFAFPAVLLGMVSPFAARLKIRNKETAGATVGSLYAISTVGSITGTFLAGFYLIPAFRLTTILLLLGTSLVAMAIILYLSGRNQLHLTINEQVPNEKN